MPDQNSIISPVNVQTMAPSGVWTGPSIARSNNYQITDVVRLTIFANYGLTAAIEQSDDGVTWSSLYSQANTAAWLLDSGWIQVTMRYFHVKITNGSTAQGGDIYANPQFVNAGAIDAKLCLFMQEPETISGGTLALSGSIVADVILANAVAGTGQVTASEVSVGGASTLRLNIYGTGVFDVQVQGQMFDGSWYTIPGTSDTVTTPSLATCITAAGVYDFDVQGWQTVLLNVVAVGTNVSAKGVLLV